MPHNNYLTGKPTPPAPLFLLSCTFLFFPIYAYSPTLHPLPPSTLSPMILEFPLYLGRDHLLVRLFLGFRALPRRIHTRSMILLSAYFLLGYPLYFCLLFLLRRCCSCPPNCEPSFRFCSWLRLCLFVVHRHCSPRYPLGHLLSPASPCRRLLEDYGGRVNFTTVLIVIRSEALTT